MKKNFVDILKDVTEEPSARCWESIEQQLGAFTSSPSGDGAGSPSSPSASSTGIKTALFKKSAAFWTKAAAVTLSSVTAVTIAVVAIVNITQETPSPAVSDIPHNNAHIFTDDTLTGEPLLFSPEINSEISTPAPNGPAVTENEISTTISDYPQPVINPDHLQPDPVIRQSASPKEELSANTFESISDEMKIFTMPETPHPPQNETPVVELPSLPSNISKDPVIQHNDLTEIDFTPPVTLEIPNVMTPNGDGFNDFFEIKGIEHCEKARMIIRNRSGKVVFESKHYENNWDAHNAEDGVYFYFFHYSINGIEENQTGTITVIRR